MVPFLSVRRPPTIEQRMRLLPDSDARTLALVFDAAGERGLAEAWAQEAERIAGEIPVGAVA